MQFQEDPSAFILSRMQVAAANLGGSAVIVNPLRDDGSPGVSYLAINVPDGTTWAAVEAAYANARKLRLFINVYTDINALPPADKAAIWADLAGPPKRYYQNAGPNSGAMATMDMLLTEMGWTGDTLTRARIRLATMYVLDNPSYLIHPSFRPSINIDGTEPAV